MWGEKCFPNGLSLLLAHKRKTQEEKEFNEFYLRQINEYIQEKSQDEEYAEVLESCTSSEDEKEFTEPSVLYDEDEEVKVFDSGSGETRQIQVINVDKEGIDSFKDLNESKNDYILGSSSNEWDKSSLDKENNRDYAKNPLLQSPLESVSEEKSELLVSI
mmetsp:Transcript_16519/g.15825  ORF Transcript_16519/g.15825 Transcript_16519/m.15825 type:complete len:160 (+) Transcript_16519:85-564(+)